MNIQVILDIIRPGSKRILNGETYDGLVWLDEVQSKPTLAELQAVTQQQVDDFIRMKNIISRIDSPNGASNKLILKILFKIINRNVPAPPITQAQFRDYLISQLEQEI